MPLGLWQSQAYNPPVALQCPQNKAENLKVAQETFPELSPDLSGLVPHHPALALSCSSRVGLPFAPSGS